MVIFADHSRDDGFPADGPWAGTSRTDCVFDVRGPLLPGLARPVAVVMGQGLAEHQDRVAVTKDQDPARQSAVEGPDDAFVDGVVPHRQLHPVRTIGTDASG